MIVIDGYYGLLLSLNRLFDAQISLTAVVEIAKYHHSERAFCLNGTRNRCMFSWQVPCGSTSRLCGCRHRSGIERHRRVLYLYVRIHFRASVTDDSEL